MLDEPALRAALPGNGQLLLGRFEDTIPKFLSEMPSQTPIGFISIDVDLYSSTVAAFAILTGTAAQYLPQTVVFFDDICEIEHNDAAGELLAIHEFNANFSHRWLQRHWTLRNRRFLKNAWWLDQIYLYHPMDHPLRSRPQTVPERSIPNPYLKRAPLPKEIKVGASDSPDSEPA